MGADGSYPTFEQMLYEYRDRMTTMLSERLESGEANEVEVDVDPSLSDVDQEEGGPSPTKRPRSEEVQVQEAQQVPEAQLVL